MPLPGVPVGAVRKGVLASQASGTTLAVAHPTVVLPDDQLALAVWASSANQITSLGGSWTDICRASGTANTLIPSMYVARRQGATGLGGTNVTVTVPNVTTRGRMFAIPACDLQNPLDHTASNQFTDQSAAQTTIVIAATTLTRPNGYSFGAFIDNSGAHTCTQPTNWTEENDGDGTVPFELATFQFIAAATTGTATATWSGSAKSLGQVMHFKPRTVNPQLLAA